MRIEKIILENFRCYYGKAEVPMDDFTVFVGKNDQGKSSIFEAVDIFINEGRGVVKIDDNDLNRKAKNERKDAFKIGIVFKDLPERPIIDATNPTSLEDEYLLNKDGFLEIWKVFKRGRVQNKEIFLKCKHPSNDEFLKNLMNKKIKELQDFVREKSISVSGKHTKSADLRKAIREYYDTKDSGLKLEEIEIKIDAEGLKDIWSKLQNYLPVYALFHSDRKNVDQDNEIQDPLKVKVEQFFKRDDIQQKLNGVANEIDKEIRTIADGTTQKFKDISQQQINIRANIPEVTQLKWKDVYKGIGFNTDSDIPLNKRGSGIRRTVLISSFLADIERKTKPENNNHLIYAIEEPETSLHPDLQMKLIGALTEMSKDESHQVLISTHSPALIRLFETSSIRYVQQDNEGKAEVEFFDENVADKIVKNLGLLPNIGKVVICVEGTNDEKFLLNINKDIDELKNIVDLGEKINSGLVAIIPMRGSNLKDWINRYALKNTNAIEFHLYDRDADQKYKDAIEKVNKRKEKDGSSGRLTQKREIENYIPKEIIEKDFNIILNNVDVSKWDNEDIPQKILGKCPEKRDKKGGVSIIKKILCGSCSKKITKEQLEKLNAWEEVKGWFEQIRDIVNKVMSYEH